MDSLLKDACDVEPLAVLSRFRRDFHACLTARADELFELADAVLCADGPVRDLAGLSLAPGHRRGHGALYDAVSHGRVDIGRLRRSLAGLALPRAADGRLVLAADVSSWLRPGAATSPERLFCHVHGRGKGQAQMIPGWPYSVIAALEPGRTSWTAVLDVVRLGPDDDETEVTAAQVRCTKSLTSGLTCSGKAAGLGNEPAFVFLTASSVTANYVCVNKGGNVAPGQPVVTQNVTGPTQTITPHNGQITFSATLPVPTPPSAATECPNGNWSVRLTSLTYGDVTLHIQQPEGVEILTFNFGTIDP